MKNIEASVDVFPLENLARTALELGRALDLVFEEAPPGRYDEFPAFFADEDGVHYILLGMPKPEEDLSDNPENIFSLLVEPVEYDGSDPPEDVSADIVRRILQHGVLKVQAYPDCKGFSFKAGDRVVRNPEKWIANDFDGWGRGQGVGEVVEATLYPDGWQIDVRWPHGRCYETADQLLPAFEAGAALTG